LSPVEIYFAQETRTYALVTLLALAGFDALLRALERPERWRWWAVYAVATALCCYGHYYAFFVAMGQVLFVLVYHRRRSHLVPMAIALIAAAVMYAPWLPSLYAQMTTKGNLSRSADSWYMHGAISPLAFAVGTTLIWKGMAAAPRMALAALALAAFGGCALYGLRALRDHRRERALLVLWLLFPVGMPLLVSALLFPFYTIRYGLVAAPAYYMLIAAGVAALRPKLKTAAVAAMLLTGGVSLATYFTIRVKHDWRGAAAWLDQHAQPGDLLLFDADFNELSYARYARGPQHHLRMLPGTGADRDHLMATEHAGIPLRDVGADLASQPRIWVISSDGDPAFERMWETRIGAGHTRGEAASFRGIEARLWTAEHASP